MSVPKINYKEEIDKIYQKLYEFINKDLENDIKYKAAFGKNKFINKRLKSLIYGIKKVNERKPEERNPEKEYKSIVEYYNKNIKDKLTETIDNEKYEPMQNILKEIEKLLPDKFKDISSDSVPIENEQPKPEPQEVANIPPNILQKFIDKRKARQQQLKQPEPKPEPEEEEPEQPKIKKEINYKIDELLNNYSQLLENPKYKDEVSKNEWLKIELKDVIKEFKKLKENIEGYDSETVYKTYKNIVFAYNTSVKHNLKVYIAMTKNEQKQIILNGILSLLPNLEIEKPEPEQPEPEPESEQQPKPEQPIKGINSTWTQPPLNERITRPNPEAPPMTTVSTTPIDDFIEPKTEPEPEEEEQEQQPEEETEQEQQMVPVDNSQQIVQSPEESFKIAKRYIDELKNNEQLDIIKGVGDVIEIIATSNLDEEMTDDLIDKMLNMKDSHGNLLFNNRFQIEDLIRNRKKRKRLKYLLPKRIIRAEKPDEQKLIINPMLRRGRIASMTSAKERYYNYI